MIVRPSCENIELAVRVMMLVVERPIPLFKAWTILLSRISLNANTSYQGRTLLKTFKMKDFSLPCTMI